MSNLEDELHYTEAEAARAFEWLREQALSTSGAYWGRPAAIMLAEVAKLKDRERYVHAGPWIACSERWPADNERVLGYFPLMEKAHSGPIAIAAVMHRDDGRIFTYNNTSGHESAFPSLEFTHWIPLPEGPRSISLGEDSHG